MSRAPALAIGRGGWRRHVRHGSESLPGYYPTLKIPGIARRKRRGTSVRDRGVGGSNPLAPTTTSQDWPQFLRDCGHSCFWGELQILARAVIGQPAITDRPEIGAGRFSTRRRQQSLDGDGCHHQRDASPERNPHHIHVSQRTASASDNRAGQRLPVTARTSMRSPPPTRSPSCRSASAA